MLVTRETFTESLARAKGRRLVVDTETTGLCPFPGRGRPADQVCGVALLNEAKESFYFPIRHSGGDNITPEQYVGLIDTLNQADVLVNHNMKFDVEVLASDGLRIPQKMVCTLGGAHLYDENSPKGLKYLGDRYLGADSSAESEELDALLRQWGLGKAEMWRLPPEYVAAYAEKDVILADAWDAYLRDRLYRVDLYDEVSEFTRVLTQMELWGIQLDLEHMAELRREASRNVIRIGKEIHKLCGYPLNPGSPAQVCGWLKTADSTDETLAKLSGPKAELIREWRAWNKGITTNYDKYLELMDLDGALHCNMRNTGTITGRLSCADPNLQAVPRWSPEQRVKEAFTARPGKVFLEFDYSQAELRVAAHYTGDRNQIAGFEAGVDAHTQTAQKLGIARQLAKTINLAIQYGAGAQKIADQLGCDVGRARSLVEQYHRAYPKTRDTARLATSLAESRGYVQTFCGRRRHFNHRDAQSKDALQNIIQASVADIVRRAMIRIHNDIPHDQARQLIQVHDSLLLEVDERFVPETYREVKEIMEDQPWSACPLKIDCKKGKLWGVMEAYDGESIT